MPFSSGTFSRVHDFTDDRDNGIRIQASRMDAEMDGIATGLSTALLKDGTQTATATIPFAAGISIIDNQKITLGTNSDITLQYDETTNDSLEIAANVEGAALGIVLKSDQGDDNADQHKLSIADGGVLTLGSKISGSFVDYLTHTPNSTVASSTLAVAGNLTVGGNLTLGSGAVLSEAELEQLDGITAGTVTASKAVVVDANKDIASFRNITLTGELDAGSLDISGDADIDGTLEADAMTLNGSAITTVATLSTGISNGNLPVFTSGVADDDFLRVNGTAIEGRSASEVLSDIGGQASLTFGISNTNAVKIDSSSVADDEYARFTANGLESRSTSEVLSDIGGQAALTFGISNTNIPIFTSGVADNDFLRVNGTSIEGRSATEVFSDIGASPAEGSSNIVTTGALNSGSITSGFGSIDTGSSTITTTGAITGGSLVVDNITLDGSEITLAGSGDMTVNVGGDIILDADTRDIKLQDGGTDWGRFTRDTTTAPSSFVIDTVSSDVDMKFKGNDGGSVITALTLDMSAAGDATFNNNVTLENMFVAGNITHAGDNDTQISFTDNEITLDSGGDIILDADGEDIIFKDAGTEIGRFSNSGTNNFSIKSSAQDKDLVFKGNDGGSTITALTLDMSDGGTALFNHDIKMPNSGNIYFLASSGYSPIISNSGDTNSLSVFTNNNERLRINSSGMTLFGCTTDPSSSVQGFAISPNVPSISPHLSSAGSNNGTMIHFFFMNGNGVVGSITTNGSATAYNTSSDYRLKENVVTDWDATTRLKQLKPSRFNFIADADKTIDGFLAHEVSSIVPEAITGTKDATRNVGTVKDADGNVLHENVIESAKEDGQTWTKTATENVYQQIDQSKIVPLLTKALQEQQATIEALTARITALENA